MGKEELIRGLEEKGFSRGVVKAFKNVQRESFVPKEMKHLAYSDRPLPISEGATISQPTTIANMLELLELKNNLKILEIGSGSGYVLALMAEVSKGSKIYGIEISEKLVERSEKILMGHHNIRIIRKDGSKGHKETAPYDRILVSAAFSETPRHLFSQLNEGGIMVCPVGESIYRFRKTGKKISKEVYPGFVFVPIVRE